MSISQPFKGAVLNAHAILEPSPLPFAAKGTPYSKKET